MRANKVTGVLVVTAIAAISAGGCSNGPRPPCFGLSVGSKVRIAIGPERNDVGNAKCGYTLDLTANEVLVATVTDTGAAPDSQCTVGVADYGPVNGWTWSDGHAGAGQGYPDVLAGEYVATRGSCVGSLELTLQAQSSDPFQTDAGAPDAPQLSRTFGSQSTATANCPTACSDTFFVTLQRL